MDRLQMTDEQELWEILHKEQEEMCGDDAYWDWLAAVEKRLDDELGPDREIAHD